MLCMYLIMVLKGNEVAKTRFHGSLKLSDEIKELKAKYKEQITESGMEPLFYLEAVPSVINNFKPLM